LETAQLSSRTFCAVNIKQRVSRTDFRLGAFLPESAKIRHRSVKSGHLKTLL